MIYGIRVLVIYTLSYARTPTHAAIQFPTCTPTSCAACRPAVHRNEECIPTYLVGHTARMEELRRAVRERWGGRMKVVGAGVGGVSIADCVKAGRQAAHEVGVQVGN